MVLPSALLIPEPWEARLADADEKCGKRLGDEETAAMVAAVVIVISTPYLSPLSKGVQGPSGSALLSLSFCSSPRFNSGPTYASIYNFAFAADTSLAR